MQTKIIATLGPSSWEPAIVKNLVAAGARLFRLNFSHAAPAEFAGVIQTVRTIEQETGLALTLLGDLSGPKIRIGQVTGSPLTVAAGETVVLGPAAARHAENEEKYLPLEVPEILRALSPKAEVTLSDGIPNFRITGEEMRGDHRVFFLEARDSGLIASNKGLAFPGRAFDLPALTEKDRVQVAEALEAGIDCLAISFVQTEQDVRAIKEEIAVCGGRVPVIVKLERLNAIAHMESILPAADGIMVARGDLGLESSLPALPVLQKKIIATCARLGKPVIVATQMLLSMVHNPLPTRAEVSDVANAIIDGADAVMLSEETAVGQYPVDAVGILAEVAAHTEKYMADSGRGPLPAPEKAPPGSHLAYAACLVAEKAGSRALACHSVSGRSAQLLSACRPTQPIYALTPRTATIRKLNLYWGIRPRLVAETPPDHLQRVEAFIQSSSRFAPGDCLVITSGQPTPGQKHTDTNQMKVYYK